FGQFGYPTGAFCRLTLRLKGRAAAFRCLALRVERRAAALGRLLPGLSRVGPSIPGVRLELLGPFQRGLVEPVDRLNLGRAAPSDGLDDGRRAAGAEGRRHERR